MATGTVGTGGTDSVSVSAPAARVYSIFAMEYRGVNGFGVTSASQNDAVNTGAGQTFTSSLTLTSTQGSGGAIVETDSFVCGTSQTAPPVMNNAQTIRQSQGNPNSPAEADDYPVAAASFTISDTWTFAGACNGSTTGFDSHIGLELQGIPQQPITVINQCYGNCGTPAVTLANTNSTHAINWNQSITLFYEFQPTISGFLLNITTSLAKTYPNGFFAPLLGWYTSPCPAGQTPFSNTCPGLSLLGGQTTSNTKGKTGLGGGVQYPVTAGTWYAVALSFNTAPEDVNDTNTNVQLFQTSGRVPNQIFASSLFSTASKIGIWAFIQGNIVGVTPPPTPASVCTNNFGTLDCLLPALSNGACAIVTATCQTSGSLFWIIILTVLCFLLVTVGFASAHVTKFVAAGDVFIAFFMLWFFIFVGVGLVQTFIVIFVLFAGSVIFARSARQYF